MLDFQKFENEKKEIEAFLAQPEAYASPDFADKSRRLSEINGILELAKQIEQTKRNLEEATELIHDPELGEMAQDDVRLLGLKVDELTAELEEKLLPSDPADDKPAIMEIRAGAGGDEASLFAGELYRMYVRYAERHGLKVELMSQNEVWKLCFPV